uniref:oleoyl-[acyl-carrier-protein] hydrolase n=1 Tax=Strigops habroptila TaxID=2489341 RepID=A0A672TUC8_STRHB
MEKVVAYPYKRPYALWRLICFPWAGDGASHLAQWGRLFSISSIRFPGRESRRRETFAKGMTDIVNEIANVLLKELQEKTLAFFGHSFGSYVSFAVPLHLKEKYGLELIHLFVSGAHAPNIICFTYNTSSILSDKDVLTYLEILGGTPSELLQNEDIKNHLISTVREDIRVLQTWFFEMAEGNIPFSCGITCFNGSEDQPGTSFSAWHDLTSGDTSFYNLPGGHFYLLEPSNEIFLIKHIRCLENAGL